MSRIMASPSSTYTELPGVRDKRTLPHCGKACQHFFDALRQGGTLRPEIFATSPKVPGARTSVRVTRTEVPCPRHQGPNRRNQGSRPSAPRSASWAPRVRAMGTTVPGSRPEVPALGTKVRAVGTKGPCHRHRGSGHVSLFEAVAPLRGLGMMLVLLPAGWVLLDVLPEPQQRVFAPDDLVEEPLLPGEF